MNRALSESFSSVVSCLGNVFFSFGFSFHLFQYDRSVREYFYGSVGIASRGRKRKRESEREKEGRISISPSLTLLPSISRTAPVEWKTNSMTSRLCEGGFDVSSKLQRSWLADAAMFSMPMDHRNIQCYLSCDLLCCHEKRFSSLTNYTRNYIRNSLIIQDI